MARLKNVTSRIGGLAPRLSTQRDEHGHDGGSERWRGWYSLKAWQDLRLIVFERDVYTCQMEGCGAVTARPVADHRTPHRGDRQLFFDPKNVQTLCKPCHDSAKQREERGAPWRRVRGGGSKP